MYEREIKGWLKHLDFVVMDMLCLSISFVLAYIIYNGGGNPYERPLYLNMAVSLMILDLVVIFYLESFKNILKRGYYIELKETIKHGLMLLLVSTLYLFAIQAGKEYSRSTLMLMTVIYIVLSYGLRCIRKYRLLKKCESGGRSLVIITNQSAAERVIDNVQNSSFGRLRITGLVILDRDMAGEEVMGIPVVANAADASDYIGREWIDEVLVATSPDVKCPQRMLDEIMETGVVLHQFLAKRMTAIGRKSFVEHIGNYTVLTTTINTMTPKQAFAKRTMDILIGLAGCLMTGLIYIFVAPMIYLSSPGPIFFAQTRIGKNGKPFKMYKFRSMYMDAEARKAELMEQNRVKDGMMFKMEFDPRVIGNKILPDGTRKTGIGDFIRKTSLDEFPQFLNCVLGTMSVVGTRPCTQDEWEKYDLHHRARMAVKPGITGMWQVSGRSEITDFEEVVRLDREYITNWSVGLDLKILLKTVAVVFKKDGSM